MYRDILRRYWGYDDFRGIQREIIGSIAGGRDTLGLMPTGGGKSITFQVPALAMDGVCIVITPLIALMKDQVTHLRERGIPASAVYSGMTQDEIITTLENCVFGGVKLLYVSPERLSADIFIAKFKHMHVSFITVDEAHCISQWGYDFRPSYLHIADIRKYKPGVPVLALTATATPRVVEDIQRQLLFAAPNVFQMSFARDNLSYIVQPTADKPETLYNILNIGEGCAIVYVRSRRRTRELSDMLVGRGISSTYYHAGLPSYERDDRQRKWSEGQVRVIVATNAFGMGIDKPDVRTVIHVDCPDSLEAYFQEAGRAARDGMPGRAILLYNSSDAARLMRRIDSSYPSREYILRVYDSLAYFFQVGTGSGNGVTFSFSLDNFCRIFGFFPVQADAALKILTRAGYIYYDFDPDSKSRMMFRLERDELYRLDYVSDTENRVITALLRTYGGLFADYHMIDEYHIAKQTGLTHDDVYNILSSLQSRHIIKYIPHSDTPYITYTRRREDAEYVDIPRSVYEERKEQYRQRIEQMIGYAVNDSVCRSRYLLRYFGEDDSTDCGHCDVCSPRAAYAAGDTPQEARRQIGALLADGKSHSVSELHALHCSRDNIGIALRAMIAEGRIAVRNNNYLSLS